jgi:chromosome segregation ATPase
MVFIESVELTNFKSYHHSRQIGPFLQTNAIVGPNGTGKSNILDAITFAFGDVSKNLRVDRLKDLIHFSSSDESKTSCAVCVRLTFPSEDKVYEFERRLRRSGGNEYFIDGEKRNKQEYIEFLEGRGIFAKHDNFVIRQGSINKMIQDGDNNRTKFIDVVSGYVLCFINYGYRSF